MTLKEGLKELCSSKSRYKNKSLVQAGIVASVGVLLMGVGLIVIGVARIRHYSTYSSAVTLWNSFNKQAFVDAQVSVSKGAIKINDTAYKLTGLQSNQPQPDVYFLYTKLGPQTAWAKNDPTLENTIWVGNKPELGTLWKLFKTKKVRDVTKARCEENMGVYSFDGCTYYYALLAVCETWLPDNVPKHIPPGMEMIQPSSKFCFPDPSSLTGTSHALYTSKPVNTSLPYDFSHVLQQFRSPWDPYLQAMNLSKGTLIFGHTWIYVVATLGGLICLSAIILVGSLTKYHLKKRTEREEENDPFFSAFGGGGSASNHGGSNKSFGFGSHSSSAPNSVPGIGNLYGTT